MSKIIVTHFSPDFDGIPAIWLLKKFHPDFAGAKIAFVPVGTATYNNEPVDCNVDVVHVDCGMGKFDHHETNNFTCATRLVWEWLVEEGYVDKNDEALVRLVTIICQIDHGWDTYKWAQRADDRYEFSLHNVLVGMKVNGPRDDEKHVEWALPTIEAVYSLLKQKVLAEREIKEGQKFMTRWGKGVAVYTANDSVMDTAIKEGFAVVVRKDPARQFIRITASNNHKVDLTGVYEVLRKRDPEASWFLHASLVLLRNGSSRNPTMKPTKLELGDVVEILKKA